MARTVDSTAVANHSASATRLIRSCSWPRVMRDTSSRSSTSRTSCPSWRSMIAPARSVLAVVERRRGHELDGVAHRGQRVAQLVGQRGQERVLPAIGFAKRFFGLPAIAHVDDRGDVADDVAGVVELRLVSKPHELGTELFVRNLDLDSTWCPARPASRYGLIVSNARWPSTSAIVPSDQIGWMQAEARRVWPVDELEPVLRIAVRDQHRRVVGDESQLPLTRPRGASASSRGVISRLISRTRLAAGGIERPAQSTLICLPSRSVCMSRPSHTPLSPASLRSTTSGFGNRVCSRLVRHLSDRLRRGPAVGPFRAPVPVEDLAVGRRTPPRRRHDRATRPASRGR